MLWKGWCAIGVCMHVYLNEWDLIVSTLIDLNQITEIVIKNIMNKKVDKSDIEKIIRAKWIKKDKQYVGLIWMINRYNIMSSIELNAKIKTKNDMNELNQ